MKRAVVIVPFYRNYRFVGHIIIIMDLGVLSFKIIVWN
jgi:hypothetical protein